jgi:hypothetical protein
MSTTTAPHLSIRGGTRPLAVLSALAATITVWLIAALAGVDLEVRSGPGDVQQVGLASVALATLIAGLLACGLLSAVQRVAGRPRMAFTAIALALLLVTLAGPVLLGHTNAARALLTSMHLAAAGVLIPALARSAATRSN